MSKYICIHGHFYQPPRENPWLEEVETQDSAYPYHDWNERIAVECYAPNTASRILDFDGKILDIVNNYSSISFNFGPTLFSWMERHRPETYKAILEADKIGIERFSGHGPAIAQIYNHIIMPLANSRDKYTQIIWGMGDFEYRFGRKPEGMWFAETAVDLETLEIASEAGIEFTILSPRQAHLIRKIGDREWIDLSDEKIDTKRAYKCNLPSGKTINIFFYEEQISREIAFSDLLSNGENFANKLTDSFADEDYSQIVNIATNGEIYGHHHVKGDMALAYCLYFIKNNNLAEITIYGEFLEKHPPEYEVRIFENSSSSCIHGVERWRSNCGCNSRNYPQWSQEWRVHLRGAMDWLRDALTHIYEKEASGFVSDPWSMRNDYIKIVLNRNIEVRDSFLLKHGCGELSTENRTKMFQLMEMARHSMLMYTSCGWFFDEISGIESVQIMQYAARAMQLAKNTGGVDLEQAFTDILPRAGSNIPEFGDGAKIYDMYVKPAALDLLRLGAHYAVSSLFQEYEETATIANFVATRIVQDKVEGGRIRLIVGRVKIVYATTVEEGVMSFAVLHFGDHNLNGGIRKFISEEAFGQMHGEIKNAFLKSNIPEVLRLMEEHFGMNNYSLWHLFKDEQRRIINQIIDSERMDIKSSFRRIYENNYTIMLAMKEMMIPIPESLSFTARYVLNRDLCKLLSDDKTDYKELKKIIAEVKRWSFKLNLPMLGLTVKKKITKLMEQFSLSPENIELLESIEELMNILSTLSLKLDKWEAQNFYFNIGREVYGSVIEKADKGNEASRKWVELFKSLGSFLEVKGF